MATSIYVQTNTLAKYLYTDGLTSGTETLYVPPGATGTWKIFAERYGYKRQETSFEPALGGDIAFNPIWVDDVSLSGTSVATVSAYTDLGTAQKVNDYEAYWRTTEAGIIYGDTLIRNGETIDWTPYDVVIDPLAAEPYSITGNTVTVKAVKLTANTITTTGTVSTLNGGVIDGVITDINGVSTKITINSLVSCSVGVFDDLGDLYDFADNVTGTYTLSIPPTFSGDWDFVVVKQAHKYQAGTFTLGTGLATSITWTPVTDDRIVDSTEAAVTGYSKLDTTQKMYDYWSYWVTTEEGIPWYKTVTWSGDVLDTDGADLDVDPLAPDLATLDPVTHKVTIRTDNLAGDLRTDGVVHRLNGATTSGLVTDSTGTTSIITFSGFAGTNKLYVEDELNAQRLFATVTSSTKVLYLLPSEQTAGLWTYAGRKTGYSSAVGDFSVAGGGRVNIQINMGQILQPDGTAMFTNTTVPASLLVDWTTSGDGTPRIRLGNQTYTTQEVYNATDIAMSTLDGLKWLASGKSDIRIATLFAGSFLFLSTGWRFMESAAGNTNATVNGFSISVDDQSIDGSLGPVSLASIPTAIPESDLVKLRETWDLVTNYINPGVVTVNTNVDAALVDLEDIKGTGFVKDTHSLVPILKNVKTSIAVSA